MSYEISYDIIYINVAGQMLYRSLDPYKKRRHV